MAHEYYITVDRKAVIFELWKSHSNLPWYTSRKLTYELRENSFQIRTHVSCQTMQLIISKDGTRIVSVSIIKSINKKKRKYEVCSIWYPMFF